MSLRISCIVLNLIFFTYCSHINSAYTREIGLFFDFINNIQHKKKKKLDIISSEFVLALAEQKTPLLVSASILYDFIQRRKYIKKKVQETSSKPSQVIAFYQTIHKRKEELLQNKNTTPKEIDTAIANEAHSKKTAIGSLQKRIKPHYDKTKHNLACYFIPFDKEHYNIYYHEKLQLYLIIPTTYYKKCLRELKGIDLPTIYDHSLEKRRLNNSEIIIGLKYKNLKYIHISQLIPTPKQTLCNISYFKEIFLNKNDIKNPLTLNMLPSWIIYLDGHGSRLMGFKYIHPYLKKMRELQNIIGEFNFPLTFETMGKCSFAMRMTRELFELYQLEQQIMRWINNSQATIASMPLLSLKGFLHFLESTINTRFLFFDTCYASGDNLHLLFSLPPHTYSFPIASGTIADTQSTGFLFPNIHMQKNGSFYAGATPYIGLKEKPFFSLSAFNNSLKKGRTWASVINSIHPFISSKKKKTRIKRNGIHNVPLLKLPGATRFELPYIKQRISPINKITTSFKQKNNVLFFNKKQTDILTLHERYFPLCLFLYGWQKKIPFFISRMRERSKPQQFYLSAIATPNNTLYDMIDAFSINKKLKNSLIICIRKLIAHKNDSHIKNNHIPQIFEYVTIVHKAPYLYKNDETDTSIYFFSKNEGYVWHISKKKSVKNKLTKPEAFLHALFFVKQKLFCKRNHTLLDYTFERALPHTIDKKNQNITKSTHQKCSHIRCEKKHPCISCHYQKRP